ncbi:MAG: diguanylate cyclase [Acidimicrobiales bacterium]
MVDGAQAPTDLLDSVPLVVLEATRSLLRLQTVADARRVAEGLVRGLGGTLVATAADSAGVLPTDISFGDGDPLLPAALPGSAARALLVRYLDPFLLDARQALQLSGRTERLAESASTDVLTGLPNRRMLERALGRLTDDDTVIMLDLDHFKRINDELGHAAGDEVLRAFGKVLRANVRGRDVVGRFGGEEFVIVLAPPSGADAVLTRLRAEWLIHRPHPITFSAGIARSVGDADQTVRLADEALYKAKDAGRDQWGWATARVAPVEEPRDYVQPYLDEAVVGRRQPAIRLALDLLDNRVPREHIVDDLLAAAQREVGERWHRNELTAADEHLASGVAAAALDALSGEANPRAHDGLTVVTCAEGDWHSLAAQMFGESLRARGVGVTVLGASTPAAVVAEFLARAGADSLAISCSVPIFLPGAAHLVDAAHRQRIPVIVGGRAFGTDARRAERIGADAWALTARDAATILAGWRSSPPTIATETIPLAPLALRLAAQADELGGIAFGHLAERFSPMAVYDDRQKARTREDLVFIVQFLAAAMLVDEAIFAGFLGWLQALLVYRGVPRQGLITGLEVLRPLVEAVDADAARLLDAGHQLLVDELV